MTKKSASGTVATVLTFLCIISLPRCTGGDSSTDGGDPDASKESACKPCTPDCEDKECGDDGCGWYCGECNIKQGLVCDNYLGMCAAACLPNCAGKNCGPDGCGAHCGECPDGWECDAGRCFPEGGGCTGIPDEGICVNGFVITCEEGQPVAEYCHLRACETDPETSIARCAEIPCLPGCFGKTCGDDGCGGSCGSCTSGESCDPELGICLPNPGTCGRFTLEGVCEGQVLVFCEMGTVVIGDCLHWGRVCREGTIDEVADCCVVMPDTPCGNVPEWGHCKNDMLFRCVDGALVLDHCAWMGWGDCKRVDLERYRCEYNQH